MEKPEMHPIQTTRLLLRAYTLEDAPALTRMTGDPECVRYTYWKPTRSVLKNRLLIRDWLRDYPGRTLCTWAVTDAESGQVIGVADLQVSTQTMTGEIGYSLERAWWGRGLATEAAQSVMEWGKQKMGIRHFMACCHKEHRASQRVAEKLGFVFTFARPNPLWSFTDEEVEWVYQHGTALRQ